MCLWGGGLKDAKDSRPQSRFPRWRQAPCHKKTTQWQQQRHLEINVLGFGHHVARATVEAPEWIIVVSSEGMDLPPSESTTPVAGVACPKGSSCQACEG